MEIRVQIDDRFYSVVIKSTDNSNFSVENQRGHVLASDFTNLTQAVSWAITILPSPFVRSDMAWDGIL